MKLQHMFLFSVLVMGTDSFSIKELEGQYILKATSMVEDFLSSLKIRQNIEELMGQCILRATSTVEEFLAPLKTVQNDFIEIYVHTKSNFMTKGYILKSTDDCLALSNTTQTAYDLAVNATHFAVASVKEIGASLNDFIDCSNESVLPTTVIKCMFNKLKTVKQEVLGAEAAFTPYKNQAVQLYSAMVSEMHACVGF